MSAPTSSAPPNAAAAPAAQQSNAPSSGASSLANEVVSISEIRNFSRRVLGELLDSVRGKKALVLDQKLSGPLGLVAEVSMLKEHGVEKIYLLNNEMLDTESKNVFYIIRPKIHHTKLIAQHIHHQRKSDPTKTYTITFVPRRTMICENVLEEEGVYGDVSILEYPLDLIPFDDDILSLEMDTTYRECVLDGDKTSLFYVAQSLMKMQSLFGIIPNVKGKGHSAKLVLDMMLRMRKEMGSSEPTNPPEIDTLILIDREADLVTPMMTQLTYEGLIDEVFRISNGFVDMEPDDLGVQAKPGQKKVKIPLNSNDKLYSEIRDLNFSKVGPELNKKAREINANYQERHSAQTVSQIRDFMKKLTSLKQEHQSLGLHTAIAEKILAVTKENNFHAKIEQEQAIVSGNDPVVEFLEDCVHRQEPLTKVLRLLCLYSLVSNGLKQKFFDQIRRDILQAYGYHHMFTLSNLEKAGLLKRNESRSAWNTLRKTMKLWVEGDEEERDVSYAFAGYAPISCRIVQAALKPGGFRQMDEALRNIAGPTFEETQQLPSSAKELKPTQQRNSVVLVYFIGGLTQAEISCFRFMEKTQEEGPIRRDYILATTKLINGDTFLEQFLTAVNGDVK